MEHVAELTAPRGASRATPGPAPRGRPFAVPVAVVVPAAVMLFLGLWGLDRGTMWRDEAATFQVARRSLPEIWRTLGHVDAVHGLYYLLMHPLLALRADETVLRLPSVVAAAVTAGLVGAIGSRLAGPRAGLWAGLLYAATPFVSHYAQEGRSYALVAAGAALATWLLLEAVERRESGRYGPWVAYAAVVAGTALLHEFAILLLAAHGATLLLSRVPWRVWRGWGCAAAAASVVLVPLAVVSQGQSEQVSWLRAPGPEQAGALLDAFAGPQTAVVTVTVLLAGLACVLPLPHTGRLGTTQVALPLAVVPPVLLYAASRWQPLFLDRYLLFCLAGVPLLAAAGAERILGLLPWRRLAAVTGVAAVAVAFVVQLPQHERERLPASRGDELARVAAVVDKQARPGDAVLFLPLHERRISLAYPGAFTGLRDVALARSPAASGTLYGQETGALRLRDRLQQLAPRQRLWVVWDTTTVGTPWFRAQRAETAKRAVLDALYREESTVFVRGGAVSLYTRIPPT
ncbi:glycosyltransferase family 39 protein [Streptomyces sp. NPDC049555]|uniref:glycosyltransferase family 39 protein n=1 Tax=Streptomyces sp. NPDC049555 TaxID=3154930 RepID=UPI0034251502